MVEWSRTEGSYRIEPSDEIDGFVYNTPITGVSDHRFHGRDIRLQAGYAMAYRGLKSVDLYDQSVQSSAVFPQRSLQRRLVALLDDGVSGAVEFEREPVSLERISRFSQLLLALNSDAVLAAARHNTRSESFSDFIIDTFLMHYPNNFSARLSGDVAAVAPRQLKRAIDFMHAHAGEALTVDRVAREAGMSVRALQVAFQQIKGTTPLAYLRGLRLKGVHAELCSSDHGRTVAQIAFKWGFTHPGRFSKQYFETFGEMPTDTLKRKGS